MAAAAQPPGLADGEIPEVSFRVDDCGPLEHAAVPTLRFGLGIEGPAGVAIRALLLNVQIQIAARLRPYDEAEQEKLVELFGTPDRWGSTLRTVPWVRTTIAVPPFVDHTTIELPVTCTYDLEVSASKYFDALDGGEVPLEFLFSGSVFYANRAGQLQTTRITWESEASFALPVRTWKATMQAHFPDAAWLRLDRDRFDRLQAYRARNALPSWEAALDALLEDDRG